MRRALSRLAIAAAWATAAYAHDPITTKLTWSADIVRIVYARCGSCHRPGGKAPMSLLTYEDARPWAKAIKEEVLERRMPPWGAIKGFGEFANDPSLTQEQLHLIADWVEGGAPEGDPALLPDPPRWSDAARERVPAAAVTVRGGSATLAKPVRAASIRVDGAREGQPVRIAARLPDGRVEPMLWLLPPAAKFGARTYWFREPLALPKGASVHVDPAGPAVRISAASSRAR